MSESDERDVILANLRRLARRLRLNRALGEAASATSLLLALLLGLTLLAKLGFFSTPARNGALTLFLGGWALWLVWRLARGESLSRAAGVADRKGGLKDELKTAFWLISRRAGSPWVEAQIRRAAATAAKLDPPKLVPLALPRKFLLVAVLASALALALSLSPGPAGFSTGRAEPLSDQESAQLEDVKSLLRDAKQDPSAPEEEIQDLERALRLLERGDIAREQALRELQQAADALAERELDSAALREDLARAGEGLRGMVELGALAEALKRAKLEEAAELLRSLADPLSASENSPNLKDLLERLARTPPGGNAALDQILSKLKEAAERAQSDPQAARESLERAAASLESLAKRMAGDLRLGEAGRQLRLLGGMMQASEAAGEGQELSGPGEPGGSSTGPPGGSGQGEPPPGEATRLAVQLEVEKLSSQKKPAEPEPEEITHEPTREERSKLEYRSVDPLAGYLQAEPMTAEAIPWRYRQLVKDYFLNLRPSADK
jgi:hypothetical protein